MDREERAADQRFGDCARRHPEVALQDVASPVVQDIVGAEGRGCPAGEEAGTVLWNRALDRDRASSPDRRKNRRRGATRPPGRNGFRVIPGGADRGATARVFEQLPLLDNLYRLACRFERRPHDAQDPLQEALLRGFRKFHQLRDPGAFQPWMSSILRNIHVNRRSGTAPPTVSLSEHALVRQEAPDEPERFVVTDDGAALVGQPCAGDPRLSCSTRAGYHVVHWNRAGLLHAVVGEEPRTLLSLAHACGAHASMEGPS